LLRHNLISDNGERGVGIVSFAGEISGNNFSGNGLYAIGLDGPDNVAAPSNWWGGADLAKEIFDRHDASELGAVDLGSPLQNPILFTWPVAMVPLDLQWGGALRVAGKVEVPGKSTITIKPGTLIKFEKESGLEIFGAIQAVGSAADRIMFTSVAGQGAKDWGELHLERALDSRFENCDFENATWAIHCHYTNLSVKRCRFRNNDGGLRFTSGPVQIASSIFQKNGIGIRSYQGFGEIADNVIANNEIGIFVRENGSGVTVKHNNLYGNTRYNIRLGDFNNEDVNARLNWWNGADVVSTVFDRHNESYIGRVLFDPVLDQPIEPELEEWQ
jgi:hypothetical protein